MPARCRGEESMSDLSTTPLACATKHQYASIFLMSEKPINIVSILDCDIHGFFGLGIHHKLFFNTSNISLRDFCSLTQKFTFTLSSVVRTNFTSGQS
jgi:hypothetical protein